MICGTNHPRSKSASRNIQGSEPKSESSGSYMLVSKSRSEFFMNPKLGFIHALFGIKINFGYSDNQMLIYKPTFRGSLKPSKAITALYSVTHQRHQQFQR